MGEHPRRNDDTAEMTQGDGAGVVLAMQIRERLDPLIAECENQMKHNGPCSPSIIAQLKALRELAS